MKRYKPEDRKKASYEKATQDNRKPLCLHQRMVTYHRDKEGSPTGYLICRECHGVFPDPLKSIG